MQMTNRILAPYKRIGFLVSLIVFFLSTNLLAANQQKASHGNSIESKASLESPINLLEEKQKLEDLAIDNQNIEINSLNAEPSEGEEPVDSFESLYKIELLVFAYVNTGEENSEIWRNPSRPKFEEFQIPLITNDATEALKSPADNTPIDSLLTKKNNYIFLNPDDDGVSDFTSIMRKMKINGHYRTLQHKIWQQKVLEESAQDFFYIEGGEKYLSFEDAEFLETQQNNLAVIKPNENNASESQAQKERGQSELIGTLQIYRSRYLHIRTNLWFSEFAENDAGLCFENGTDTDINEEQITQPLVKSYTALTNFRLVQHRRMRSSELHYLDHPRFGLLIKFTRIEKPQIKSTTN